MSDTSTFFELLTAGARRRLLLALTERETLQMPDELPDRETVGTSRGDRDVSGGQPRDTRADTVRLYHVHLPKLETAGFVEWNREERTVSRGPAFGEVAPGIELLAENADKLPGAAF